MEIKEFFKLTEKQVKKYINSCGVKHIQELYRSDDFMKKLNLEGCKSIRTYHRSGLKVSIFYSYTDLRGTPDARISLRIWADEKGKIHTVHWEESGSELLYEEPRLAYFGQEFHIWPDFKLSDFKTPWEYIEELKKEREKLEPLITEAIENIGENLDDYLKLYTQQTIDRRKNNFIPCCVYSQMVVKGSVYRMHLEETIIPFIVEVTYSDCNYFQNIRTILDSYITDLFNRREITDFIDKVWEDKELREEIRKKLLNTFGNNDIAEKIIQNKLNEYKKELRSLYLI